MPKLTPQSENSQTAPIGLFRDQKVRKVRFNQGGSLRPDGLCPSNESLWRPVRVLPVVHRHMDQVGLELTVG